MAEATGTYSAEQVERLLNCAICLDRFTNPKILPCQHTFCKSPCLEGLVNMVSRLIRCPECRAEHFVPREGADGFPTNITLSGFLDLPAHRNTTPSEASQDGASGSANKCGVCECEAPTVKCFHCQKMVCESCKRSHSGQMKVDIGRLLNQIRKGLPKLSNSISAVEQKSEQTKARMEAVKSEVHDTIERYTKELRDREKMLHSELDTYLQGEQRSLRLFQENIEVELASISSYCDSTESVMNQADSETMDADLVNIKKQCLDYSEQIRETENNPVPEIREVNFTFDGQPIHSSITNFGLLNITTPSTSNRRSPNGSIGASTSSSHSAPSVSNTNRARWSDIEPLDTAMFEDFSVAPSFSYTPRTRTHSPPPSRVNRSQYTRPTRSSMDLGFRGSATIGYRPEVMAPSPRHMPSRTNDYMFQMASPGEEDLLDIMDRNRMDEINRRRIRGTSVIRGRGSYGRPHERVSGLMGGISEGAVTRGRGITPRATSPTYHTASTTSHSVPVSRPSHVENSTSNTTATTATTAARAADAAEQRARVTAASRPAAAAFIVPLHGGPVQDISREQPDAVVSAPTASVQPSTAPQQTTASEIAAVITPPAGTTPTQPAVSQPQPAATAQQPAASASRPAATAEQPTVSDQPPAQTPPAVPPSESTPAQSQEVPSTSASQEDRPPPAPQEGRRRSRKTRTRGGSTSTSRNQGSNSESRRRRSNNEPSTSTQATTSPANVNNNSNTNNVSTPQPSTSAAVTPPAPEGLGSRSRTFVREDGQEAANVTLPRVNGMSSTFEIPLTETISDLDTTELSRISVDDSVNGIRPINNYRRKGGMKKKIGGERGNGQSQFTWPRGVAISPINDSIVVADSSNHRAQIFDLAGHFVSMFGSYGQSNGEFDCLAGVVVNSMGQIIIADRYNHRIQVFDRYGQFCNKFGEEGDGDGMMNYPWGVACDRGGFIYVCDKENHRIQVFQADGTFVRKFGKLGQRPGQLENPHYITVGHDGNIIVSDCNNHRLQVFSDTGRFVKTIGTFGSDNGQLKYPKGVAVDRQGFIIVADSGNNRIQVFRGDGRFYSAFGSWGTCNGQFKGLEGIGLTSNGDIVVSDKENHRIQIF